MLQSQELKVDNHLYIKIIRLHNNNSKYETIYGRCYAGIKSGDEGIHRKDNMKLTTLVIKMT